MIAMLQITLVLALALVVDARLRRRAPEFVHKVLIGAALTCLALLIVLASPLAPTRIPVPLSWPAAEPAVSSAVTSAESVVAVEPGALPSRTLDAASPAPGGLAWPAREFFALVWGGGVLFGLTHWWLQWARLFGLVRGASRDPELERAHARLSRRPLRIAWSQRADTPFLWVGASAVRIILPESYRPLGSEPLQYVILHELAHHARRDNRALGLCSLFRILLWWHPLAWLLERAARASAELAADAEVLARGIEAPDYAALLLDCVRQCGQREPLPATWLGGGLSERLHSLLEPAPPMRPASRLLLAMLLVGGAGATLALEPTGLPNGPDAWVLDSRARLSAYRHAPLAPSRLQLATFYDGAESPAAMVAFELIGADGSQRWYRLPPLVKFDRGTARRELLLARDVRPSGRVMVSGLEPDGIVDGVAVAMAWSDAEGKVQFLRSHSPRLDGVPRTICAWPLAFTSERMFEGGRRYAHWEMDTLQRLLCGSELLDEGVHAL